MALLFDRARPVFSAQNIRPPLGSFFNGQAYQMTLYPELGSHNRSVLVVRMVLQFQFEDGSGGTWTAGEKNDFAHGFVNNVMSVWSEKFRITTASTVPLQHLRDVGVVFEFPYYIDGWHADDDFELSVTKVPSDATWQVSTCGYSSGNTNLDSNDLRAETKGASMTQCDAVHEFGHMLGLRDEYPAANDNRNHLTDRDSIMNVGQAVRQRHYAPFAGWLTERFAIHSRLLRRSVEFKVEGVTDLSNALL